MVLCLARGSVQREQARRLDAYTLEQDCFLVVEIFNYVNCDRAVHKRLFLAQAV